jgi:hypothetical protein
MPCTRKSSITIIRKARNHWKRIFVQEESVRFDRDQHTSTVIYFAPQDNYFSPLPSKGCATIRHSVQVRKSELVRNDGFAELLHSCHGQRRYFLS